MITKFFTLKKSFSFIFVDFLSMSGLLIPKYDKDNWNNQPRCWYWQPNVHLIGFLKNRQNTVLISFPNLNGYEEALDFYKSFHIFRYLHRYPYKRKQTCIVPLFIVIVRNSFSHRWTFLVASAEICIFHVKDAKSDGSHAREVCN